MSFLGLIIFITLLLSAFFSGVEIAFVSSNRLVQELDLKRKILPARILASFFNNPSRLIGALLLGNNIALVIYGIAISKLLEPWIINFLPASFTNDEFVHLLLITLISTLLILLTAEFIPKVLFRINPNTTLKFFAIPVWLFYYLFYPINMLYIGLSELLLRYVFRVKLSSAQYEFSAIDLEEYVKEYRPDEENIEEINQEIQMIQNAMDFKFVKLRECKIPRTEIKAIEIEEDIDTLRAIFSKTGHSKIMVYEDSIDNLIGYVHASEMFEKPKNIRQVTRKVEAYPETMTANTLLSYFIKNRKNIAIVVDEFGGSSGIVTLEDIMEEVIGEIREEFDDEIELEFKKIDDWNYLFEGKTLLNDVCRVIGVDTSTFDEVKGDADSVAGLFLEIVGQIPKVETEISYNDFHLKIVSVDNRRIKQVLITLPGE